MPSRFIGATPAGAVPIIVALVLSATVQPARAQVQRGPSRGEASATNCSRPGGQPAPPNFASAVKVFGTEDQPQSIPLFSEIIDDLLAGGRPRTVTDTPVLACSLSYRAEARLNLGQPDQAEQDLRALCDVAPSFIIDQRFMSRWLVDSFDQICQAWLRITVGPRNAQVTVDDVLVDVANPVLVKPGVHQVTARHGEQTVRQQVEVGRGATLDVKLEVQFAWLRITVSQRNAQVTVDDVLVDVANPVLVKPGVPHLVAARRCGQTMQQQEVAGPGETLDVRLEVPRCRPPLWPFALGTLGAGGTLAITLVEDHKLKKAVAERQLPRSDLELIQDRRDAWRQAVYWTGGFSVGYLVMRQIVGGPSNEANFSFSVEPLSRGIRVAWRLWGSQPRRSPEIS